ncbi:recombination protein NinB [Dyella caseinilytica]|uniref:Recombination protein NinB n=1 Tax=Dyella caseinilytica TaxID=1849581 RepID=A0ABX7GY12_9GAMM|nr:recombination protein NinB [Dyella caseinilytica]QRN55215.1 recombination protein NinB [Dyella caseinilytica]GGA00163.1 hypothetical protein GCM10011408_21280 [Dyella caseinilytica]
MKPLSPHDWKLSGDGHMTDAQRRLLNAACGDLAEQLIWHGGLRLSRDDYRHMLAGTLLGWRSMPGIDRGDGQRGWIMLGGSSLDMTRSEATDAITLAFVIGDVPEDQGLNCKAVHWCAVVLGARGIRDSDDELAARYAA